MATIYDIAKRLGIAPSTVSRAYSNRGYCDPDTKKRVLQAAEELGYHPNRTAKSLRIQKTERLIIAIPDICNPFYFALIDGMSTVVDAYNYSLMLVYTKGDIQKEIEAVQSLNERYADGMFLLSHNFESRNIAAIRKSKCPIVISNVYDDGQPNNFDCVMGDVKQGIYLAASHLIAQGHRRIAFLGNNTQMQTSRLRLEGFKAAFRDAGLPVIEELLYPCEYSEAAGREAARKMILSEKRPSAIVACNDMMALGAMNAIKTAALRIPEDIAVTGMDDTEIGAIFTPSLTSAALGQRQMGQKTAELLIRRIQGDHSAPVVECVQPELIIRESSVLA